MSDTFDWAGLWDAMHHFWLSAACDEGIDHATATQRTADELRTRIEAAFVPVEDHRQLERLHDGVQDVAKAALARAEAAEARVKVLEEALELADAALRGANMNMNVVERKISQALGAEHGK